MLRNKLAICFSRTTEMGRKRAASTADTLAGAQKRQATTRNSSRKNAATDGKECSTTTKTKPHKTDKDLANSKSEAWSKHQNTTPFPDFLHPTASECHTAHRKLSALHSTAVAEEFADPNTPETIPHVLDAMIVAVLSQATGWSNAKRAMTSMKQTYGSVFAYDAIMEGGREKLQETIKCGGLHVRKSMIITTILEQVRERYGKWDLDHLFAESDGKAMKELLSYKYMGPKSASVVMTWCLKRESFTVDAHIYRIAGLWGWRPEKASKELTQSHLNAMIPKELQFDLHFLLIAHGRACPACRGGAKPGAVCLLEKEEAGE
jgi:endonuclease III